MSGAASRNRGANAERAVVNYLKAQGWITLGGFLLATGTNTQTSNAGLGSASKLKTAPQAHGRPGVSKQLSSHDQET